VTKPANFPARKRARQCRAQGVPDDSNLFRSVRTQKKRAAKRRGKESG
jgi:hypothetical protein